MPVRLLSSTEVHLNYSEIEKSQEIQKCVNKVKDPRRLKRGEPDFLQGWNRRSRGIGEAESVPLTNQV